MPRPKYIADVHEARYELRVCTKAEEAEKSAAYQAALRLAAQISGKSEHELKEALLHDFYVWMRQEGLPKPSRK